MTDRNHAEPASVDISEEMATGNRATRSVGAIGRRGALAMLGGVTMSGFALAQESPILPTPGLPMPAPILPSVAPAFRPIAAPNVIPASALGPISRDKTYFIFFQVNIDMQTAKTLRSHLVALVEAGVTDITIVIASGGGLVVPTLQLYNLIRLLPAKIKTHAQILVASAATILYLAGEDRSTDANANFLFHPAQTTISGSFSTPQFADQMELMNVSTEFVESMYRERTKMPDTEIKRFRQETVIYDAPKALELGIVQSVGALKVPSGDKSKFVFVE